MAEEKSADNGNSALYLPLSIMVAAVLLCGTIFIVGADLGGKLAALQGPFAGAAVVQAGDQPAAGAGATPVPAQPTPPAVDFKKLAEEGPIIGDPKAPVTIVEFSDFSCPFCAAVEGYGSQDVVDYLKGNDPNWVPALPKIMEDYVKAGKVRVATKYFPGHGSGVAAHQVGLCVNDQSSDFFWKYHGLAFADQANTGDVAKMKALAAQAGADSAKLDECIASKKFDSRLAADAAAGRAVGVGGTPYFYLNGWGTTLKGAYGYADFKKIIDSELSAAS